MCAENVVQECNACDLGEERRDWLRWVLKKGQEVHQLSNDFPGKWLEISEGNII